MEWCKSIFDTLERLRYTSNVKLETGCAYSLVAFKISQDDRLCPGDVSATLLVSLSMWVFECFTCSLQEPDKWTIDYIISNEDYIIKKLTENDREMLRKFLLDLNSKHKKLKRERESEQMWRPKRTLDMPQVRERFIVCLDESMKYKTDKIRKPWTEELVKYYYPKSIKKKARSIASHLIPGKPCYAMQKELRLWKEESRGDQQESPERREVEIPLAEIEATTNNFHLDKRIGSGGEADVYEGKLKGRMVAIKRYKNPGRFTMIDEQLYIPEMYTLQHCHHENIVDFVGFAFEKDQDPNNNIYSTICVVTELVQNHSLHTWLHRGDLLLKWEQRVRIILGICSGLVHLHFGQEKRIIHRDLKPENILIDEQMRPKIADFGCSKFLPTWGLYRTKSHTVGTRGYIDPDYFTSGRAEPGSDMFSFGIIIYEIISGEKTVKHVLAYLDKDRTEECDMKKLLDPKLDISDAVGIEKLAKIAHKLTKFPREQRPDAMEVMKSLEKVEKKLNEMKGEQVRM